MPPSIAVQTPDQTAPLQIPSNYQPVWKQAGRATQWGGLGKVQVIRLLLAQVITAIVLFWLLQQTYYVPAFYLPLTLTNFAFLGFRFTLFSPPVWSVIAILVVLFLASRWLLDGLLMAVYGMQPLALEQIGLHSPETERCLRRFCQQRKIPAPTLGLLPTAAPVIFSYGCLPRVTRVVISQGLLEQLADDEIATLIAAEIGHIALRNVPLLSLVMAVIQIPYTLYRFAADLGDRQNRPAFRTIASLVSALFYGLYSLWRWAGLWLSRQRVYYSDRAAVELTGNPNGYARALTKLAIGTANSVRQEGKTNYLLEGFELLLPLSYRMATPVGSVYPFMPLEMALQWGRINSYRHWLAISNSHPPMGDRLHLLMLYAQHWKLPLELDFNAYQPSNLRWQQSSALTAQQWRTLLLLGAPFFGVGIGLAIAYGLSALGWVGSYLKIFQISWLYQDSVTLWGLPIVGFCLGMFLRINPLFPELPTVRTRNSSTTSTLPELLKSPTTTPLSSEPIQLTGKLLGRPAIGNALGQDLWLQTETGLVRLHTTTLLGAIGYLLPQKVRPADFLRQEVTVTGWFRHGATPWIDVEMLRTTGGRTSRSYHPEWSTLLGAIAAVWGTWILWSAAIR
jgi:Zn-dependent protease with chaperone function